MSNGQVTRYYYEGDSILLFYETDGTGSVLRSYVYSADGIRLAMKTQGTTLYYHYNPRGDVVSMTDDQNTIVAKYRYDEWGNVSYKEEAAIAADNPFGYAGYWYEEELGMYYLMARYYQPAHGVFLSQDPDPGDEDDALTQNGYTYANNNPVMYVDPNGNRASFEKGGVGRLTLLRSTKNIKHIIVDDVTKKIIQISDRTKPWKPDSSIKNPYKP
ncbi:RHS repeat-associated core domain-containing protein [Bacillus tianshenii]|uniref:RHS repeat-associated core domain-containing protein n=1 Tax=Sutcliffiella tianshenii TaxID=1463404 RepID=UPI00296AEFF0|nr:RHS repeat-associated core domain-containing protein [Bacillus tianshenii]